MALTSISLKLDVADYRHLKQLARDKYDGNMSELIRNYLPKRPRTIQEEYQ